MKDQKKAEEIAAERVQLLSPLLAEDLDTAQALQIRYGICEQAGISERTLRRYLTRYQVEGFAGLKPKDRNPHRSGDSIPPGVLEQAILLRRQVPRRSVGQIIQILEWEGLALPGQIRRSTLQDRLAERGYSTRQMRIYAETGGRAVRRFQKRHRNQLWTSDIKYGPYLPIGKDGSKKQAYLVTFSDDATRAVLHGEFYPTLDQVIVEDCFRQAIQKFGAPTAVFFDNGKQYPTKWMSRACSKMGIRLLFARPYAPESKGKIEKYHQMVDKFLAESALEKPQSLDRLNELFWVWLEECYQNKPHSALENNMSPAAAYNGDSQPIRFLDADTIACAFLHCEERKVDKAGCISFEGKKYEVGLSFIGCKVDVVYDPADTEELTIEYEGRTPWKAGQLVIGEKTGERPRLPEQLLPEKAESSRLLAAAAKKNRERKEQHAPAISYRAIRKGEGDGHV
jgi:transposase InsO family protein